MLIGQIYVPSYFKLPLWT